MNCFYCKGSLNDNVTNHVVNLENRRIIIIRDVPCEKCTQCGESYYNDYTMSQIENIVNDLKSALTIPNSITTIEQGAFSSCTKLSSVTIPNSVKSIESSAFSGCTALKTVTIPNSVTTIGWGAFSSCENLTSITFRRTLPPLFGVRLFEDTENVNTIYVPAGSKSAYQKIGQLSKLDIIEISVKQNAGTCEECKICISGNPPEKGKILGGEPTIFDGIEILKYLVGIESYVV